jgi:type IV secretory pathway VirB10-like protein
LKDPDTENLDAGWDDVLPDAPPAPTGLSAEPAGDLEDLDSGWDETPSSAPSPVGRERAEGGGVARRDRLSKRERRELERQMRARGNKSRAERRAEEQRARKEAQRRAAEERAAERREALERAARLERAERKKRAKAESRSRSEKGQRSREQGTGEAKNQGSARRRRFQMPNGGWIIVVIAMITLGTARYACDAELKHNVGNVGVGAPGDRSGWISAAPQGLSP